MAASTLTAVKSNTPERTNLADERVLVLDFGSQYAQLIARRVREQHVYCEIVRHDITAARLRELAPRGIILSGGPASVYADGAPQIDPARLSITLAFAWRATRSIARSWTRSISIIRPWTCPSSMKDVCSFGPQRASCWSWSSGRTAGNRYGYVQRPIRG